MVHRRISVTRFLAVIGLLALLLIPGLTPSARAGTDVPGWRQSNVSGFGIPANTAVSTLAVFGDSLYAATWNDNGSQVWRTADGHQWTPVTPPWTGANAAANDAVTFGDHLYIGTSNENGGEIWRTDGVTWEQVAAGGFGDAGNYGLSALALFGGRLYAATGNLTTGIEIWRSSTGNAGSWQQVNQDGFGGGVTWENVTMDLFADHLYIGTSRAVGARGRAELWRSPDGTTWSPVFTNGLGYADNSDISATEVFKGQFYVGLRNGTTGGQLWRSSDGLDWTPVFVDGLGKQANSRPYGLIVHKGLVYLVFSNIRTGAEVWRSPDGDTWLSIMQGGWDKGSANGFADYFDNAAAVFRDALTIGTVNEEAGGEVWQMLHVEHLPLVLH